MTTETTHPITQVPYAESEAPLWQTPSSTDLIFDDGEPLETNRHRIAMNVLIDSAVWVLSQRDRTDFFVGGNMFVYYSGKQQRNEDYRGPDFFAALGVDGTRERQGWVVWEEGGHYPDVIIELLSESTAAQDKGPKKDIYERIFKTSDYFIFDPFDPDSLQGWRLDPVKGYQALNPNPQGWLWSKTLELWVGPWEGVVRREPATGTCTWLRFYDAGGNLVPLYNELAEQAEAQAARERRKAEQERQKAEQERQRAERLAQLLRDRGIDPDAM